MLNNPSLIAFMTTMLLFTGSLHADETHHHDETASTIISKEAADKAGITTQKAGGATITHTLSVTGRVTLNQNMAAQVKARFPGIIQTVSGDPGQTVQKGDVLATVESNDSLQVYPVKAPMDGTIITRNANIGELASNEALFVIANLDHLWAELFIFSKDGEQIQNGQKLIIHCLDDPISTESSIAVVLPTAEASSQSIIARAVIDNSSHHWRSGMNIRADIVLSETHVPLAVQSDAIQIMEGKPVVFVKKDDSYIAHPVKLGSSDKTWTQITSGLRDGAEYVTSGSFIIKADIGKSSATHAHD